MPPNKDLDSEGRSTAQIFNAIMVDTNGDGKPDAIAIVNPDGSVIGSPEGGGGAQLDSITNSHDLSGGALDFKTTVAANWQANYIALNISTSASRNLTISINDGTNDFIILQRTAWSGQAVLITEIPQLRLAEGREIRIQLSGTGGIVKSEIGSELI